MRTVQVLCAVLLSIAFCNAKQAAASPADMFLGDDFHHNGAFRGRNYFVAGPWNHGKWQGEGEHLGPVSFGSDTAAYYRDNIGIAFFDYWLRGKGTLQLPEATTFETGTNRWRQYDAWPPVKGVQTRKLYFQPGTGVAGVACAGSTLRGSSS